MSLTSAMPVPVTDAASISVRPLLKGPFRAGLLLAAITFGGFGVWAAAAPLVSGTVAPGVVSPELNRRVVQHLEGGIVRSVPVQEGQAVKQGDLLMTMDSTGAEAEYASRREEWLRLLVVRARLDAHAAEQAQMVLPPEAMEQNGDQFSAFVANQRRLFEIRQMSVTQQRDIFERRIEQLQSEIAALEANASGLTGQLELVGAELADKQNLLQRQLISRSEVSALQREQARLQSDLGAAQAQIARAGQNIEEIRLSRLQADDAFRAEIAEESTRVNNQLAQLEGELRTSRATLERTELRSPVDGVVINLAARTPGVVAAPGEPLMEVVPADDDLIIVAKVPPRDIDLVETGLEAQVSLVSFSGRNTLPLVGTVTQVAADASVDERSGQHFYEVRAIVTAEELTRHPGVYLRPGMPADVTVVTGERTMLQYLMDPMLRSLRSAFVYD